MAEHSRPSERLRRWRLILGASADSPPDSPADSPPHSSGSSSADSPGQGSPPGGSSLALSPEDQHLDQVLQTVYDAPRQKGGFARSSPQINRWLSDIRRYFPASVVRIVQRDAMERLKLDRMLLEPELLASVQPDLQLVATLLALKSVIPEKTRETARQVVREVAQAVERQLREHLVSAVRGACEQVSRTNRPRPSEIDWNRTIRKNLKHYQPDLQAIIPEHLVGFQRRGASLRDVILCVDQSGSMAASVVYSGIIAAVLASLRSVRTRFVVFDTQVVDLTEQLHDVVDLLFGTRLGGGTDLGPALAYCRRLVQRPEETILFLVSDLFDSGSDDALLRQVAELRQAGVQIIVLLALSDDGRPAYNESLARKFAAWGIDSFGCTPDQFPDLLAAAIRRQKIGAWATAAGIPLAEHAGSGDAGDRI